MLTVSYFASERLLAEASTPDDAVIRVVVKGREVDIGIDIVRPGDTTFDHGGEVVLAIDEETSEFLADSHFDVEVTGEESRLVLTEQI